MKKILLQSYNRDAINYEKKFKDHQYTKYSELLGENASILQKYKNLLDLGCGTGLLHDYLAEKKSLPKDYTGIDLSQGMLQITAAKKINICAGDLVNLPFKDNTFDAVVSFTVIKIMEDEDSLKILQEARRVLQPLGLFIVSILTNRLDNAFRFDLHAAGFTIKAEKQCGQDTGFICYRP